MSTTLTIQNLIRHFEDRLCLIDQPDNGDVVGKEPQFPQLVIYLGADAHNAHQAVSSNLLQIWSQYKDELKFVGVQENGGVLEFSELACGIGESRPLSEDGVRGIASALFGTKMHFTDRSKLLVYYVLDTTSFLSRGDFLAWLPVICKVKQLLCADLTDLLDVLVLLLNENHVRQRTALQIRNSLSGFYQRNEVREAVDNILLLSNRRSDNAILEDWDICYKILSAAIVLSNNSDTQVTMSFFSNCIMTASYAREEKPLPQIGQVVVKGLIGELAEHIPQTDTKLLDDPHLPEKLGLTGQGTFSLLDEYAQNSLYPLLPSEEQLELFPRKDDRAQMGMASMSAKAFDEYTMGAWNQYLAGIAQDAQEKVSLDSTVRKEWNQQYRNLLVSTFSKEEIMYLCSHLDSVAEIMAQTRAPSQDSPVLIVAKEQLKYMLSSDETLIQIFLNALQQQGQVAVDFTQTWNNLLKSMRTIHTIRDNNITTFYDRKVRNFYDRHGAGICSDFVGMHDTEELVKFLNAALDHVIDNDEIFSAAFEDELESRLSEDALPTDAKQYIRKKLTGNEVFTYLQTNFALGEPLISSILLKVGSPLYKNLYSNLAPTTYYYNTGSSNAAEALVIYEVSAENLVNGEG